MHSEVLVTAGILAVVSSAVFAAVFNPLPPKPGVVGIDLGTTFSVIALFHNGSVEVVHDDLGKNLTPSTVAFLPSGDVLVGHPANDYGKKHPESVVFDAKRLIGHRFDEDTVQHDKGLLPFGVVDVGGNAHIQVTVGGKKKTMSPESVGAHVLTKLKKQVEKYIGRPVLKAVLAVPADFTEEQRNATMDAGRQAGLDVLRIISEPTAAALAYGLQQMKAANILVYDFGGGTLDVSLLMLEGGVFEVAFPLAQLQPGVRCKKPRNSSCDLPWRDVFLSLLSDCTPSPGDVQRCRAPTLTRTAVSSGCVSLWR